MEATVYSQIDQNSKHDSFVLSLINLFNKHFFGCPPCASILPDAGETTTKEINKVPPCYSAAESHCGVTHSVALLSPLYPTFNAANILGMERISKERKLLYFFKDHTFILSR